MKRGYRIWLAVLFVCALTGCGKKSSETAGYQVYYTNAAHSSLLTESYTSKETDVSLILGELLERMQRAGTSQDHYSLIPEEVEVEGYNLTDGQLTVVFNDAYNQLENVSEILLRAGVVETVTQVKDVRTVVFHIGDDVLKNSAGEPVGAMTSSMFINNPVGINSYQYASLTLYFSSRQGDKIVKEMRNVHYSSNTTLEKVVMEQIIKGPMNKQLNQVVPDSLRVLNISVDKKTCVVNLDEQFLAGNNLGVQPEAAIYSIVNSLCDVLGVDNVQFQVNGESDVLFGDSLSLNGPFHRNSEIIESAETMYQAEDEDGESVIAKPSIGL